MKTIKQQYDAYIQSLKAKGIALLGFKCPHCKAGIQDRPASTGEVWDSLATCPHCDGLYFKVATPDKITATIPA